jgi:hypothetical protein
MGGIEGQASTGAWDGRRLHASKGGGKNSTGKRSVFARQSGYRRHVELCTAE